MSINDRKISFGFDIGGTKIQPYAEYKNGTSLLDKNGDFIKWEEDRHYIDKTNDTDQEKKRKITDVMLKQLEKYTNIAEIKTEQIEFIGIVVPGQVEDGVIQKLVNIGLYNYDILKDFIEEAYKKRI